jgi:hypothetical protein
VPGWTPNKVIRLVLRDVPQDVRGTIAPEKRIHAKVNLSAEGHDELFFDEWELR